jgi:hypothetical protein
MNQVKVHKQHHRSSVHMRNHFARAYRYFYQNLYPCPENTGNMRIVNYWEAIKPECRCILRYLLLRRGQRKSGRLKIFHNDAINFEVFLTIAFNLFLNVYVQKIASILSGFVTCWIIYRAMVSS